MAKAIVLEKYKEEIKVLFNFDFSTHPNILAGQTLQGASVTAEPNDLTIGTAVINGAVVQAPFTGGESGRTYTVVCECTTNVATTLIRIEGNLYVKK